jgi:hypothetical protein
MDIIEACKTLMDHDNILSSDEKEFMKDCIDSSNPELFIQVSINHKIPVLMSILKKIEKLKKEIYGDDENF